MRTTVTLDPEVERLLHEEQYRTKKGFKEVLNAAVRASLQAPSRRRPKILPPRPMGLRPGIDPCDLAGPADELETEVYHRHFSKLK